jgi:hypothetical protein
VCDFIKEQMKKYDGKYKYEKLSGTCERTEGPLCEERQIFETNAET